MTTKQIACQIALESIEQAKAAVSNVFKESLDGDEEDALVKVSKSLDKACDQIARVR